MVDLTWIRNCDEVRTFCLGVSEMDENTLKRIGTVVGLYGAVAVALVGLLIFL